MFDIAFISPILTAGQLNTQTSQVFGKLSLSQPCHVLKRTALQNLV